MANASRSALGCFRSIGGTVRTTASSSSRRTNSSPFSFSANANTPHRRFSFISRLPVELGCCVESLIPLHSAVASARLTSRLAINSRSLSQGTLCRTSPDRLVFLYQDDFQGKSARITWGVRLFAWDVRRMTFLTE